MNFAWVKLLLVTRFARQDVRVMTYHYAYIGVIRFAWQQQKNIGRAETSRDERKLRVIKAYSRTVARGLFSRGPPEIYHSLPKHKKTLEVNITIQVVLIFQDRVVYSRRRAATGGASDVSITIQEVLLFRDGVVYSRRRAATGVATFRPKCFTGTD